MQIGDISVPDIDLKDLIKIINQSLKRRMHGYKPYKKQLEFHNSKAKFRVLSGGNRVGKSYSACYETAMHSTGMYPDWFKGHRIKPVYDENLGMDVVLGLVIGKDATSVRDTLQKTLIGSEALEWKDGIIDSSMTDMDSVIKKRSISGGAIEQITIKRIDGGITILKFRTDEQGRERLQGFPLDFAHMDEEPTSKGVFGEITARLQDRKMHGNGIKYMSFTPLSGLTELVQNIWKKSGIGDAIDLIMMSVYDVPHLDPEECKKDYEFLPEHEREARLMGTPAGGESKVYNQPTDEITDYPPVYPIPETWRQLGGIDFGRGQHPFAITWICEDPETGIKYLYKTEKRTQISSYGLVDVIKNSTSYGLNILFTYPHDMNKKTGTAKPDEPESYDTYSYVQEFKRQGLKMTRTFAHTLNAGRPSLSVDDGIEIMRRELYQGKLKISPSCTDFIDEYQLYSYDENAKIVKKKDDILDSTRYNLIMFDRYAKSANKMKLEGGSSTSIAKYFS